MVAEPSTTAQVGADVVVVEVTGLLRVPGEGAVGVEEVVEVGVVVVKVGVVEFVPGIHCPSPSAQ